MGIGLGVVVGGGNILRGATISENGLSRPTADAMGMLATVMNALVLETAIERAGVGARTMSALAMPQVCETYERRRALRHLEDNRIIVFAGGTGNPYFTTDTTAVLRAAEMGCDAVLKATDVDGVYTADPKRDPSAKRYEHLDHQEALDRKPENHGCDGVRACPGEPYAYHRFFDPGARCDRDRLARQGALHHGRLKASGTRAKRSARSAIAEDTMATATFDMNDLKRRMQGAIASLKQELGGLRTGRASSALLDHVQVEAYGSHMPLNQLATISVPEPRLLNVQVWDRSMIHPVEKAISAANLGLTPATEGQLIKLRIPELNEERRRELVKVAHKYAEAARVAVRHVRRDGLDLLKKMEKDHKISEDEHERQSGDIQKATDATIADVDKLLAAKEKEIMTV